MKRPQLAPHRLLTVALTGSLLGLGLAAPLETHAFCGFYVAGADAELFANATMVVLMREGTRTVLSMQNDYQGPPEDFALVIPVPVVLHEGDVQTLAPELLARVDKLAAPRLVEYWEQDPCNPGLGFGGLGISRVGRGGGGTGQGYGAGKLGVTVEAQFDVEEYEVVILSANESTGLDTWLREQNYNIPAGAEPLLRPYVEDGMKFFVAKVDASKVKFDAEGRAQLSPLRFHYDSEAFSLPIRLGLINAAGKQDLIVHILAPKTRYDVANYPKATIPTNLEVKDEVRERFGEFYVSLFDHTLAQTPKAVITEYAWSAGSCDPCPDTPLTDAELTTLGADVLPSYAKRAGKGGGRGGFAQEFVLTRLHARYDASELGEDLVFEQAGAIVGGRERYATGDGPWTPPQPDKDGKVPHPSLEQGARPADSEGFAAQDNFQARYVIRHDWEGPTKCEAPQWGMWGAKPESPGPNKPTVARELAYAPRGGSLGSFVSAGAAAQLGVAVVSEAGDAPVPTAKAEAPAPVPAKTDTPAPDEAAGPQANKGCSCSVDEGHPARGLLGFGLLGLLGLLTPRSRRGRKA